MNLIHTQRTAVSNTNRYGPSTPTGEFLKSGIFVGGFAKALARERRDSSTSSTPRDGVDTLPFPAKDHNLTSLRLNAPEMEKQAAKKVINFNLTRTKERLGNITNTVKREDV